MAETRWGLVIACFIVGSFFLVSALPPLGIGVWLYARASNFTGAAVQTGGVVVDSKANLIDINPGKHNTGQRARPARSAGSLLVALVLQRPDHFEQFFQSLLQAFPPLRAPSRSGGCDPLVNPVRS